MRPASICLVLGLVVCTGAEYDITQDECEDCSSYAPKKRLLQKRATQDEDIAELPDLDCAKLADTKASCQEEEARVNSHNIYRMKVRPYSERPPRLDQVDCSKEKKAVKNCQECIPVWHRHYQCIKSTTTPTQAVKDGCSAKIDGKSIAYWKNLKCETFPKK
mmetsp:Transcript_34974/g.67413  ORF Transcript_34974/g.67413 Transcript_34974/m.67413 type:complete len:162 (-) Transcript_34974:66-551(-)